MHVIDIDPQLLERSAAAARHAAEQADVHMDGEEACLDASGVPKLLETLTPTGPWAWAIMPQMRPDGSVMIPIATTREEIADCYRVTRTRSNVLGFEALVEVRGAWYTFQEGVSLAYVPSTATHSETETLILFPVTSATGITGELAWWKMPREQLGSGRAEAVEPTVVAPLPVRRDVLAMHERYVEALRGARAADLADVFEVGIQSAVRDYVEDTGTLVGLDGLADHQDFYDRLFRRYEVDDVLLLERVVQDWYVFAELRITVRPRSGPDQGRPFGFNIAEFLVPAADGRFIARIGHGTDLARIVEA
ncbi:MAG TPA: hypothetical protein VIY72_03635 [Acidimicrobiales bacterium]